MSVFIKQIKEQSKRGITLFSLLMLVFNMSMIGVFFISLPAVAVSEPEPLANPELASSCGIDMVLVLDSSDSMTNDNIQSVKDAANLFVSTLLPATPAKIGVIDFDTDVLSTLEPTNDISALTSAINSIGHTSHTERTNWEEAIDTAQGLLAASGANPDLMVVITDGNPTTGNNSTRETHYDGIPDLDNLWDAILAANDAKRPLTSGTRILGVGIGDSLTPENLIKISSSDAYYDTDFAGLANTLADLATELCGGTITVKKVIDGVGKSDWQFSALVVGGSSEPVIGATDDDGFINFEIDISGETATVDISETSQEEYILESAICLKDQVDVGLLNEDTIEGILIGESDIISCEFTNRLKTSCGDGTVQTPNEMGTGGPADDGNEACDDGNNDNGDGCSATCTIEDQEPVCGDGVEEGDEECDDGNIEDGDGCSASCTIEQPEPVCGNQVVEDGEQCDDGNTEDGDGCSSTCQFESDINPGDIVVNEVMMNPYGDNGSVSDQNGEWFEIYNNTDHSIDLDGCIIRDNGINSHTIGALAVPAYGYAVLGINNNTSTNGGVILDYTYTGFGLDNSDDEVILKCNQTEIDNVVYSVGNNGWPSSGSLRGASMILAHPSLDNNIGSNWCVSSSSFGDGFDLGTPGSQNDSCGISYCGDGTQDQGEECDDGNNQDGDGCSGLCVEEALGIISGFKFWDMDGSLETTTDRQGLIDWVINLLQDDQVVNTATTDQSGYYEFSDLEPGAYNLEEELLPDWSQLFFPSNIINIVYDSIFDNQNFINTEEAEEPFCGDESCNGEETCSSCPEDCGECEVEPYCGDGSCNNEETCSTCPEDCGQCEQPGPYCGDGSCNGSETCSSCSADCGSCGGGGGGTIPLRIHNEKVESRTGNTIIVSWFTNHSATSRVVYDTVSHPVLGEAPNYGYANSTEEDPTKVTYHTVTITGLVPNTAYYLMPISHGSPEVHGIELESTEGGEGVIVLGEAGAPSLSVSKTVNKTAVDAGEQNIEYTVSITNSGNLTAFDVAMADTLPANFSFSDGGGTGKSWTIGDLEPGQTHEESYLVNLASNISDGIYANIVQVSASNHDTVTASVDLEVEAGETLVGSGIKMIEYILLIITALFLMSIAQVLKRKEYNI